MKPAVADPGSVTVETLLLAPVLVVLTLFAVFAGRAGETLAQVRHAADQAARSGVVVRAAARHEAAREAALAALAASGRGCRSASVDVALLREGDVEVLAVRVACEVERRGLDLLAPSPRVIVAESREVVDRWRAEE